MMIETAINWLVDTITILGYPGVFISVFLESFIAPIPSEIILPFSGFVASNGSMNVWIVILVATFAAYLGSMPFYFLGRLGEKPLLRLLNKYGKYLFIENSDVDSVFRAFDKYGNGVVFFGRLIPLIRTLVSFPAGVAKMNFVQFSIYTILGSLLWNIILVYTGFILGDHWNVVGGWVNKYEKVIIVIIVILFLLYIGRGIYKRIGRKRK